MASLNFNSFADDISKGNIVGNADTFKAMLVTNAYAPNKDTHTKRSDVTNEVSGAGYSTGGTTVTCTVAKDTVNDKETWTFANPSWPTSTFTARAAVIYKSRGGASSADELVSYVDFGADITASGGTFAVTFSSPLTFQN